MVKVISIWGAAVALIGSASLSSSLRVPTPLALLNPASANSLPRANPLPGSVRQGSAPVPSISKSSSLISQLSDAIDLNLLAKASANFFQSDRYQTESEIQVKATSGATSLTSTARVVTTVQSPNQFRSEIFFSDSGDPKKPDSIVVSNGKQVWITRPGLKQYAVTPYPKFDQVDDNYWIGMSSLWFLEIPPEAREPIAQGALSDPKVQKQLGLADDVSIKGTTQTVDGQSLYVYEYVDKEGFAIRAFVEPTAAALQQVVVAGKSEGYDVVITERILKRTANPSTNIGTFQPPPRQGSKQVKTLAIGPL